MSTSKTDSRKAGSSKTATGNRKAANAIDPVTLSVLWSRLISVGEDMGSALRRTAYSAAVREGDDFSTGLFDRQGRMIAQGNFSPGHLGAMPSVVQSVLAHYPAESLRPGDCILLNDSRMGSGHYPDCFVTSPVFVDERLMGFVVNCAHHVDMGGAVAGSQIVAVKEAFQEGLRILPVRFIREGELQEDVLRLILGNVRLPDQVRGDLMAQRNTNVIGAQRLAEIISDYGPAQMDAAVEEILTRSETRMRELIGAIPDGSYTYEDYMDDSGVDSRPIHFHVVVTIAGDQLTVDWSGSSDQVAAGINSYINYTRAYSIFAIKVFTDPYLPQNEGAMRPIDVVARPGSFFNPTYPAPSSGRAAVQVRLFEVICGALARVIPNRAMASFSHWSNPVWGGTDDAGKPFIYYDMIFGGYGARADKDGAEALAPVFNATNIPVEVHESHNPVLVRRLELMPDTAGAGTYRGGAGLRKDVELLAERATVSLSGDRHVYRPPGLFDGEPGTLARTVLNPDGEARELDSKGVHEIHRGDILSIQLSGAGGYGPPAKRDPDAVRQDVADGFLSEAEAKRIYGVDVGE